MISLIFLYRSVQSSSTVPEKTFNQFMNMIILVIKCISRIMLVIKCKYELLNVSEGFSPLELYVVRKESQELIIERRLTEYCALPRSSHIPHLPWDASGIRVASSSLHRSFDIITQHYNGTTTV